MTSVRDLVIVGSGRPAAQPVAVEPSTDELVANALRPSTSTGSAAWSAITAWRGASISTRSR